MAVFTIVYEYQRCITSISQIWWSFVTIIILLIGIFGVIFIPEENPTHYIFASAVFFAMIGFMIGHTVSTGAINANISDILRIILYAQILFMVVTVIGIIQDKPIFMVEALFILNFAIFYLFIHLHPSVHEITCVTNLNI